MVELAARNAAITFERMGERLKKEQRQTIGALKEGTGMPPLFSGQI